MRIVLTAVGRARRGPLQELFDDYAGRIVRSGPAQGLRAFELREIPEARAGSRQERMAREGEAILAALDPSSLVIALDEGGEDRTSSEFAGWLAAERDRGTDLLTFVIGGADGLDPAVARRASGLIAFGRQTWPHLLVRTLLVEQIYRALTILGRHPYHRD